MTRSAVEVFGVIRFADEHELEPHVIAVRARLSKGQVSAAVRDLCALGVLVRGRSEGRVVFRMARSGTEVRSIGPGEPTREMRR